MLFALCVPIGLVFAPKKIEYRFYRAEGGGRDLYKNRVPKRHGAVPETGQLERLQFPSILGFDGDETRVRIPEPHEVKWFPLIVPQPANQVHGIEMGSRLPDILLRF
jgi:hypothetical protein